MDFLKQVDGEMFGPKPIKGFSSFSVIPKASRVERSYCNYIIIHFENKW